MKTGWSCGKTNTAKRDARRRFSETAFFRRPASDRGEQDRRDEQSAGRGLALRVRLGIGERYEPADAAAVHRMHRKTSPASHRFIGDPPRSLHLPYRSIIGFYFMHCTAQIPLFLHSLDKNYQRSYTILGFILSKSLPFEACPMMAAP